MSSCMHFGSDTISFRVPTTDGDRTLRMLTCSGRDQVVKTIADSGWRTFEPPMPEVFFRACQSAGGMVLDVGANTGFYALLAASARQDVHVVALEPAPQVKPVLDFNVALNGLQRQITTLPVAMSNEPGSCDLFIPLQDHGLVETSASLEKAFKEHHSEVITVETDTIDRLWGRLQSDFPAVSIIKIDVEGHEAAVLRGAASTIRQYRPLVFIEVLPRADLDYLNAFLRDNRYCDMPLRASGERQRGDTVAYVPDAWNHIFMPNEWGELPSHTAD